CAKTDWNDVKAKLEQGRQNLDSGFGGQAAPMADRQKGVADLEAFIKETTDRYAEEIAKAKYGADADKWREIELREKIPVPAAKLAVGKELGRGAFGGAYRLTGEGGAGTSLVGKTSGSATESDIRNEEKIYALVGEHPNITKCYGVQKI